MAASASGFVLSWDNVQLAQRLALVAGTNDPNEVLTYALRFLNMVIEYQLAKRASRHMETLQQTNWSGPLRRISWQELEVDLANALRLWLTLQANMPINRIILDRPRSAGGNLSMEVPVSA